MNKFWMAAGLLVVLACQTTDAAEDPAQRRAFFGDLHIHTMYSLDAFLALGVRTSPDAAYRFAKGEAIPHPTGEMIRLSGPPLDFLMVSDHAGYLGVNAALLDPTSPTYGHPDSEALTPRGMDDLDSALGRMRAIAGSDSELTGDAVIADAWQKTVDFAEKHNDPGTFTTFVGYEYTPSYGGRHLHRNVVFRSARVPDLPFSARDSLNPEDLWDWMDNLRAQGIESLAIPHNMNQSDGMAFPDNEWLGESIDAAHAEQRMRNEPIAEISQNKGTSETHPSLSPNDEWADFQIVQYYLNRAENKNPISIFKGGYYRDALRTGLEMQSRYGFNPYQLGAIGSSDAHTTGASYEEDNHFSSGVSTPQSRGSAYSAEEGSWENFWTPRQATHGTGGLAGVWADDNTRDSLYQAMQRKETFATSGPRIRIRFFGGADVPANIMQADDPVAIAYAHGQPMGGVLPAPASAAPRFFVWAARDPGAGWLQRIQIVKGWVKDGMSEEIVYDVGCSDGLTPDPATHRCPDNGARVNLADCSITRDKGAVALDAVWQDPDFDPQAQAFYYARVLENPSCRWSTWDALRLGIEPNPDLQSTIQERAWSSPIWYQP